MKALLGVWLGLAMAANPQPAELVSIPAGTYRPPYTLTPQSGKKPAQVRVARFKLARYPVTNAQFLEFVRSHPQWRRSRVRRLFAEKGYLSHWRGDLSFDSNLAQSPVVNVSWFAARAYCHAQGRRLPSQAEWEYAAQASRDRADGSAQPDFRRQVLDWYARPQPQRLPAVQQGFRNYFGVWNMHGLVWEWVEDFNTVLVTGESRGDAGLERDLYCAGGSVGSVDPSNYASSMRYAFRASLKGCYTMPGLGFRCADN